MAWTNRPTHDMDQPQWLPLEDLHLFSPWVVGPAALALRKWRRLQTSERNSYQVSEVKKGGKPLSSYLTALSNYVLYIHNYINI